MSTANEAVASPSPPMPPETLTALQGSIAKWQAIVDGTGVDNGAENCPLCQLFHADFRTDEEFGCSGCPVSEAGHHGCGGTPYDAYSHARTEGKEREAAVKELAFLKSLLPEGVSP
jgi:hypothetical protein